MSEPKKKPKKTPEQESSASPFPPGLFANPAAESAAVKLLQGQRLEWASIDGGIYVKFLTSEGRILRVQRDIGDEG